MDFSAFKTIRWEQNLASGSLWLSRPDVRNAFNPQMILELTQFFKSAHQIVDLKSIVFRGEGSAFCAGADLEWMKSMKNASKDENFRDSQTLFQMFSAMQDCPVPILGCFHGALMGGALGLASLCDLSAAEDSTQFAFSEVRLGLAPAVISPFVFSKVSVSRARRWMLTGERFSADEALKIGLIQFRGGAGDIEKQVFEWVHLFDHLPSMAVREIKGLLNRASSQSDSPDDLCRLISDLRVSPEGQEGLAAFLEKRRPKWLPQGGSL